MQSLYPISVSATVFLFPQKEMWILQNPYYTSLHTSPQALLFLASKICGRDSKSSPGKYSCIGILQLDYMFDLWQQGHRLLEKNSVWAIILELLKHGLWHVRRTPLQSGRSTSYKEREIRCLLLWWFHVSLGDKMLSMIIFKGERHINVLAVEKAKTEV